MNDPRITKLAELLVNYSVEIKPGQNVLISAMTPAEELALEVYAAALRAGGLPFLEGTFPEEMEILCRLGSDAQLDTISPMELLPDESFDAEIFINARANTRLLSRVDPERVARRMAAYKETNALAMKRAARQELRWCVTLYPTNAHAQEAEMCLREYSELIFTADKLYEPEPVAAWEALGAEMRKMKTSLEGGEHVVMKGSDIDLRLSIKGRKFVVGDGKVNLPDGEIYTGPVESSTNGWARFRHPIVVLGREYEDIELWFEDGKVVKEKAAKNQEALTNMLNGDAGARYLGEWGIGMNYSLTQHTKAILFDEKLGGTIHLAVGASYPETGGVNESGVHWDMICDMAESEIHVDGELFYKDGKPVV